MDSAWDWAGIAALVAAVGTATVAVMAELRKGRAQKADPEQPGSGAALCERVDRLTEAVEDGADEQRAFNRLLARHLGMIPLPTMAPADDAEVHEGNGNGGKR